MQLGKKQLQRQQVILAHLGFYKHKCDGIWGPDSIAAKRKFESSPSFIPALPNNGLPFGEKEKYPKGIRIGADRLLTYTDPKGKVENNLTPEHIKKLAGDLLILGKVTQANTQTQAPILIPKQEDAPVVTTTEVLPPTATLEKAVEEVKAEEKSNPNNQNNQNKHNHNHKK
jgi:hypothetical protein